MEMKSMFGGVAVLTQVLSLSALACTEDGREGIFPENNVRIPVSRFTMASEKVDFDREIKRLHDLYAPVFEKQGRTLDIRGAWDDATVNAYATRESNTSVVQMFGGLFRHPLVTVDAFDLVICHELGHHIGGAPKKKVVFWETWAANEGQSDYFATLKCSREAWKNDDNAAIVAAMTIPASVTSGCQKNFDQPADVALCQRGAMAGKSLADTLGSLATSESARVTTDFEKPDSAVVSKTDDNHPKAQCRLDTYFAGAVCSKSQNDALSEKDPTVGTCSSEKGDATGIRPVCWYKPGQVR